MNFSRRKALILSLCVLVPLIALCQTATRKTIVQPQPSNSSNPGRYQIVINPNVRADTFLIDTQTGKVWIPVEYTNLKGHPAVWKLQDRVDSEAEFNAWAAQYLPENPATLTTPEQPSKQNLPNPAFVKPPPK